MFTIPKRYCLRFAPGKPWDFSEEEAFLETGELPGMESRPNTYYKQGTVPEEIFKCISSGFLPNPLNFSAK